MRRQDTIDWKQKVPPRKDKMLTTNMNDAMDTKRDTCINNWSRKQELKYHWSRGCRLLLRNSSRQINLLRSAQNRIQDTPREERWTRSTKIQHTLTTDMNERSNTNFYDKSERHVFTTDSNDTMKDGPRRNDEDARHVNDGCERNGYI